MKVIKVNPSELRQYEQNARKHPDAQIQNLSRSIKTFGFNNPVLIDDKKEIIAGHGRAQAAIEAGLDEIPCIVLSHLSQEQKRAYMLADNKISDQGGWDDDLLCLELSELKSIGVDLDITGFGDKEWKSLLPEKTVAPDASDDDIPPVKETCISEPGDIWLLDNHRVMCGDSTNTDHMNQLVDGHPVDMVWTDPPYNVDYTASDGKKIKNDKMTEDQFRRFLSGLFTSCYRVAHPGCPIYVAYSDSTAVEFRQSFIQAGWYLSQTLIWVKSHFKMSRADYHNKHEPILYGWKEGKPHSWYGGRKHTTVMDANIHLDTMSHEDLLELARSWQYIISSSVIKARKPVKSTEHPTMKPVFLILQMMTNSSVPGSRVLDPCGGSGSTLIAAEKINRTALLMEIDRRYCDVIVNRWQTYTGREAIHSIRKTTFNESMKEVA